MIRIIKKIDEIWNISDVIFSNLVVSQLGDYSCQLDIKEALGTFPQ
jgi:hypothetical protein